MVSLLRLGGRNKAACATRLSLETTPTLPGTCPKNFYESLRHLPLLLSFMVFPMVFLWSLERAGSIMPSLTSARAATYQGFGASTPGGAGQSTYRVTHLGDGGSGSLREAVAQGSRNIVFNVAGEIKLSKDIYVKGSYLTIDGLSAPSPGITLRYHGLIVDGSLGARDVIVRGIRVRDSQGCDSCSSGQYGSGIIVANKAYNVVIDRVSVQGAYDQAISIVKEAHDVTVQWSIFGEGPSSKSFPILIGSRSRRISFHHNLVLRGYERMPQVMWSDNGDTATDTQADLRNNIFWDWGFAASQIWKGTKANVVNNYYHDPNASDNGKKRAIYFCKSGSKPPQCDGTKPTWYARAYIKGNVSGHGGAISDYLNSLGTESQPFSAPTITMTDACTAAQQVLANAGVRPLDAVDQKYISMVSIAECTALLTKTLE
jgi:hypothetical protein